MRAPLISSLIGDGISASVYNIAKIKVIPWTDMVSCCEITTQPEESKEG